MEVLSNLGVMLGGSCFTGKRTTEGVKDEARK